MWYILNPSIVIIITNDVQITVSNSNYVIVFVIISLYQ